MHLQQLHSLKETQTHKQLKQLLAMPSVDILDEMPKHKFELVYAWGAQCALASLDQRISMVQHVLKILGSDKNK